MVNDSLKQGFPKCGKVNWEAIINKGGGGVNFHILSNFKTLKLTLDIV